MKKIRKNIIIIIRFVFLIFIFFFVLFNIDVLKSTANQGVNIKNRASITENKSFTKFPYSFDDMEIKEERHKIKKYDEIKLIYNTIFYTKGYAELHITYPQIYGFSNKEFEISLNRKTKEVCERGYYNLTEAYREYEIAMYEAKDEGDNKLVEYMENINFSYNCNVEYYLNGDIISIILAQDTYTGGAHSNSWFDTFNINLKKNKIVQLADLMFNKNGTSKVLEEVNKQNVERTTVYNDGYADELLEELSDPEFYIKNNILIIHYNPYAIGSYAEGHIEFEMPFKFKNNIFTY